MRILSSAYGYPDQLLLAINGHIAAGCAAIEAALAQVDREEGLLLHDPRTPQIQRELLVLIHFCS